MAELEEKSDASDDENEDGGDKSKDETDAADVKLNSDLEENKSKSKDDEKDSTKWIQIELCGISYVLIFHFYKYTCLVVWEKMI